ncbi:NAC domain-containing protein 53-like [Tasmannia lanceolata]|uniref:NAC domain-containing protein 53-like n=1 Tax=Tasmannia lanceolata TaxID=3420 RepID=UPI00406480DD
MEEGDDRPDLQRMGLVVEGGIRVWSKWGVYNEKQDDQVRCYQCRKLGHIRPKCSLNNKDKDYKGKKIDKKKSMSGLSSSSGSDLSDEEDADIFFMGVETHQPKVCLSSRSTLDKWYLDSGFSRHITGDPSKFTTLTMKDQGKVTFGDSGNGRIIGNEVLFKNDICIVRCSNDNRLEFIATMDVNIKVGGKASLVPGFRFHPTDEELLGYFLKRKVCGKALRIDVIPTIDPYKFEPWDLPAQSHLNSRDLEWYFFSALDKKYVHGSRKNRSTDLGFWKKTGKDRSVSCNSRTVGMKKTFVFHIGHYPRGNRTDWVMHEYKLHDEKLEQGIAQDAFVLSKIFKKSGPGPKQCEQYGAPFLEEEWDDYVTVHQKESGDNALSGFVQPDDDHQQNTELMIGYENAVPEVELDLHDSGNHLEDPVGFLDDQEFLHHTCEHTNFLEAHDDQKFDDLDEITDLSELCQMFPPVTHEYYLEPNDLVHPREVDYTCGETAYDNEMYFDAPHSHNPPTEDGPLQGVNDILNVNTSGSDSLDDFLTYFNATDNDAYYASLASSPMLSERVDSVPNQPILSYKLLQMDEEMVQSNLGFPQVSNAHGIEGASTSNKKSGANSGLGDRVFDDVQSEESRKKSMVEWVYSMLESFPSPPANAAEHPLKWMSKTVGQNSATQSSGPFHASTEMICAGGLSVEGNTEQLPWQKDGHLGFLLNYDVPGSEVMSSEPLIRGWVNFDSMTSIPRKVISVLNRSGFSLYILLATLVHAVSFKIGSFIYTR